MIWILIIVAIYLTSLFTFRWMVKKDIKDGYDIPLGWAMFFSICPMVNTIMCMLWLIGEINVKSIAKKFFK